MSGFSHKHQIAQEIGNWRSAETIRRWLDDLPHEANSGDIYALRP